MIDLVAITCKECGCAFVTEELEIHGTTECPDCKCVFRRVPPGDIHPMASTVMCYGLSS